MRKKKYLLLGGAGFIGQHLAQRLRKQGNWVGVIDNLSTSRVMPPASMSIVSDVLEYTGLEDSIKCCDVVYWLAGSVGVFNVVNNPRTTLFNNLDLAYKIVPLLEKHNKQVIFTSTSEVYGEGPFREDGYANIGESTNLRWGYAAAKLMTEFMITSSSFPSTITRLFNIVGPRQLGDYGMVLPRFVDAAVNNRDIVIHGTGDQVRTFCHINDALDQFQQVEQLGGVWNIGCDENAITVRELANRVVELSGSSSNIIHKEVGYSDINHRIPDMTKLKSNIDYHCNYSVDGIIRDMLEQYDKQ